MSKSCLGYFFQYHHVGPCNQKIWCAVPSFNLPKCGLLVSFLSWLISPVESGTGRTTFIWWALCGSQISVNLKATLGWGDPLSLVLAVWWSRNRQLFSFLIQSNIFNSLTELCSLDFNISLKQLWGITFLILKLSLTDTIFHLHSWILPIYSLCSC